MIDDSTEAQAYAQACLTNTMAQEPTAKAKPSPAHQEVTTENPNKTRWKICSFSSSTSPQCRELSDRSGCYQERRERIRDEERNTPADAMDIVRDAEREADARHDDEGPQRGQGVPLPSEASDGPESRPGR